MVSGLLQEVAVPFTTEQLEGLVAIACQVPSPAFQISTLSINEGELGIGGWALSRQLEFVSGRYCARKALESILARSVEWSELPRGKDRAPIWPKGAVGSISHTSDLAWGIVGKAQAWTSVGSDLEKWMSLEKAQRIQTKILQPQEPPPKGWSFERWLTLVFSAKETLFKCIFQREHEYFGFHEAIAKRWDAPQQVLWLERRNTVYAIKTAWTEEHVWTWTGLRK